MHVLKTRHILYLMENNCLEQLKKTNCILIVKVAYAKLCYYVNSIGPPIQYNQCHMLQAHIFTADLQYVPVIIFFNQIGSVCLFYDGSLTLGKWRCIELDTVLIII